MATPRIRFVFGLLLTGALAGPASALFVQGTVRDTTGTAVQQALVVVTNEADPTDRYAATTDAQGRFEISVMTAVLEASGPLPTQFQLFQNWPNPFNPSTQLGYSLEKAALVELSVYNVLGQKVRVLDQGYRAPGVYPCSWDGHDYEGRPLSAGVFLYRLQAGDQVQVKKMVMVDGAGGGCCLEPASGGREQAKAVGTRRGQSALYTLEVTGPGIQGYRQEHLSLADGQVYDVTVVRLDADQQAISIDLPNGATMEFVWIEPGTFMMGAPDFDSEAPVGPEKPQHQVTLKQGFWLGKYELTQGQWSAVMGTSPWSGRDRVRANANNPAVYISWDDMQAFVRKLNVAAGDSLYRLPTEAEWEYACRAGTTTPWSFEGDRGQLGDYAWYDQNAWNVALQYAQPVGKKMPTPWGLYDMHGNVNEWVQDRGGEYPNNSQTDPEGPSTDDIGRFHGECIYRGGSFDQDAAGTRSAKRGFIQPQYANPIFWRAHAEDQVMSCPFVLCPWDSPRKARAGESSPSGARARRTGRFLARLAREHHIS